MKKRVVLVCVLLLVLALVFVSCGGEAPVPETPACAHENMKVTATEPATCLVNGYEDKVCEKCGYTERTVLSVEHDLEESYQIATDADVSICKLCGVKGYLVYGEDTLNLSGYFGGDVSFLAKSFGEACRVELLIDGEPAAMAVCKSDEEGELTAKDVGETQHEITFVNHGADSVFVREESMKGKLNRKGAVIVEVLSGKADRYNSINFYVQTSDPSGDYYVRYKMLYEYNEDRNNFKGNSGTNISNYRIKTAQLVKVDDVTATAVRATDVIEVLQSGEISLASRQRNMDPTTLAAEAKLILPASGVAPDFIGGHHGDERLEQVELYVDGEKVELYGNTEGNVIPGTYAQFDQTTTMYAWGTSTSDSYGIPVILHSQHFVFDSNGVRNNQTAEWLVDDYEIEVFYFQMFTMRREVNGRLVCEKITSLDADGNVIESMTVPMPVEKDTNYLSNLENRAIRYSSDVSGISAEAGYEILGESMVVDRMYVMARKSQGDNKLYVSFCSPENGQTPVKGEVFDLLVHYHIDYVNPEN